MEMSTTLDVQAVAQPSLHYSCESASLHSEPEEASIPQVVASGDNNTPVTSADAMPQPNPTPSVLLSPVKTGSIAAAENNPLSPQKNLRNGRRLGQGVPLFDLRLSCNESLEDDSCEFLTTADLQHRSTEIIETVKPVSETSPDVYMFSPIITTTVTNTVINPSNTVSPRTVQKAVGVSSESIHLVPTQLLTPDRFNVPIQPLVQPPSPSHDSVPIGLQLLQQAANAILDTSSPVKAADTIASTAEPVPPASASRRKRRIIESMDSDDNGFCNVSPTSLTFHHAKRSKKPPRQASPAGGQADNNVMPDSRLKVKRVRLNVPTSPFKEDSILTNADENKSNTPARKSRTHDESVHNRDHKTPLKPLPAASAGAPSSAVANRLPYLLRLPPKRWQFSTVHCPSRRSQLFKDIGFLITKSPASSSRISMNRSPSKITEARAKQIKKLIHQYGSTIFDDIESVWSTSNQAESVKSILVVADSSCRTAKYLLGLSLGICPVSMEWVEECCRQITLLDPGVYRLPIGVSHATGGEIIDCSISPLNQIPVTERLWNGSRIFIVGYSGSEFSKCYPRILQAGGAVTDIIEFDRNSNIIPTRKPALKYDYIIAEDETVVRNGLPAGAVAVSSQWVCQCLIQQELLQLDQYRIDGIKSPGTVVRAQTISEFTIEDVRYKINDVVELYAPAPQRSFIGKIVEILPTSTGSAASMLSTPKRNNSKPSTASQGRVKNRRDSNVESMSIRVQWYYRGEELSCKLPNPPRGLTRSQQNQFEVYDCDVTDINPIDSIIRHCTVQDLSQFMKAVPHKSSAAVYYCRYLYDEANECITKRSPSKMSKS
eukprot:GILJ01011772.1.p1 GENE.GILJ01011772.1~~GILJ01011772.1.p1  ORF type:complete len:971 (-),score=125.09 GILJ01011772.1:359-2848(-)